ncbi:glycosidase PH1107-related [Catenulispora acidiphila DSM 44928]|uniref:Glycosidase PH1107-related n=1 Tax=Catenulispora acidiphila (strain DSM 44928 / JCM 14897 / NBRC 102108 / NRRL B-24433 / ID139908) TaxID=479433 RepID=C7QDK1_CATAD|nr:glycosidase PH1107-like protein [Catenulispora acidiphila]ACU74625.1 glycosidase PH1107-related [Catenulispora acidiphila DSM 44928]
MKLLRRILRRLRPDRPGRRSPARLLALMGLLAASLIGPATASHASDYTSSNLPDWAIGPFTRQAQPTPAPVLSPTGTGWESQHVLNPGVVYRNGAYQMLYRADGGGPDQIGHATSTDGLHFTRDAANPVIQDNVLPYESGGVTDPRLYELNGTYYSFVAAYDWSKSPPQTIMETTSTDLVHWTTAVPIVHTNYDPAVVTDGNDTPVLMNTQYGPRYVMYYGDADPAKGRFVAYSTDMKTWTNNTPFDMHFPANYTPWEICVTVTDYQTVAGGPVNHNIVMFVAGTLMAHGRWYYGVSEVEFSGTNLTQQIGQLTEAVLSPSTPYEINGRTQNTIFMNSILFHNGQWSMYYGAADTVIGLATAPLRPSAQSPFSTTGFENANRYPDWADAVDSGGGQAGGISNVTGYPGYGLAGPEASMRQETAHGGSSALMYSGAATGAANNYAYMQLFDTSAHPPAVDANTTLSYWIYPQNSANSTCVALDVVFSDGSALRNLGATDQNGNRLHPAGQCGHLALNQWNLVTAKIGTAAAGKTPVRIDLGYDQPGGNGGYRGYVDDISLTG